MFTYCESTKSRKTRCLELNWVLMTTLALAAPLLARQRGQGVGDVGEHIEEVALFRVDNFLHLGEMRAADALLRQTLQQLLARVRGAPQPAEFRFVLEEIGQLAESISMSRKLKPIIGFRLPVG